MHTRMCTHNIIHTHTHLLSDEDFEVTAEMLIHDDVDDESTLDEEEALQEEQDDQEIADLQKVWCASVCYIHLPFFSPLSSPLLSLSLSLSPSLSCTHVCLTTLTIFVNI